MAADRKAWAKALQAQYDKDHPGKKYKPLDRYQVLDYRAHHVSMAKDSRSKKKREKFGYRPPADMAEKLWHQKEYHRHAIGYTHGHKNSMAPSIQHRPVVQSIGNQVRVTCLRLG